MTTKKSDLEYFSRRDLFASQTGSPEMWSLIDQWPLYVGTMNLARNLAITELFKSTLSIPGHLAEFGTWKGSTTLLLAKLLDIFDSNGPKLIHVFDSFEGLTNFHETDGAAVTRSGEYSGSRLRLEECARLVAVEDSIEIIEGQIEQTLPEFMKLHPEIRYSFVYCDTDLYQATKVIFQQVWPALSLGGIITFDQWNMNEFPGEGVAVNQFLSEIAGSFEMFKPPHTRQPTLAIRRLA